MKIYRNTNTPITHLLEKNTESIKTNTIKKTEINAEQSPKNTIKLIKTKKDNEKQDGGNSKNEYYFLMEKHTKLIENLPLCSRLCR